MARKPTGRPRGRPADKLQYPRDVELYVKMAEMIHITRQAKTARAAAKQLAKEADGDNTLLDSKARRLERNYKKREQWLLRRAKARWAAGDRRNRAGTFPLPAHLKSLGHTMAYMHSIQRWFQPILEEQQKLQRMLEEHERMTKLFKPF